MSRIAVVGSYGPSLLNFRGDMIRAFRSNEHRVLACAPEFDPQTRSFLEEEGVEVKQIPLERQGLSPRSDLKTLRALYRTFQRWQPDYVFSYTVKPVIYGSWAAWAAGAEPYALMTGLGYAFTVNTARTKWLRRLLIFLYWGAYKTCNTIIFQNPDDRERMIEEGALSSSKPTAIVNGSGIDTKVFTPVPLPETPVFLCMARLVEEKGIREYVEAARRVRIEHPDATFRLAGWPEGDSARGIKEKEVSQWEHEGSIEYLGYVDDVQVALAETTVYVLPSYREGTPRSVLEAMAMGRPIITSDAPGCRETVNNAENGWLVPPRDVDQLEGAIRWMIKNPRQWCNMGSKSRKIAVDKYDVKKVNQCILNIMNIDTFNKCK